MATLTLKLTPELEQQLLKEANQQGLQLESYALTLLQQQSQPSSAVFPAPTSESDLLQQI